jgi:hypothetical protein
LKNLLHTKANVCHLFTKFRSYGSLEKLSIFGYFV